MEIWDLYTSSRELTGQTHVRGTEIPDGSYHLVVHVWIKSKKGKYLISQRSANRPTFPLMWECVGGSAIAGESSLDAALRETKEEVGITLSRERGRLLHSVVRDVVDGVRFGDILDVWVFDYDGDINLDDATTDEVECAEWMTFDEIKGLYREGKLVKTLNYFFTEICGCAD